MLAICYVLWQRNASLRGLTSYTFCFMYLLRHLCLDRQIIYPLHFKSIFFPKPNMYQVLPTRQGNVGGSKHRK